jgi:hypothetical protein
MVTRRTGGENERWGVGVSVEAVVVVSMVSGKGSPFLGDTLSYLLGSACQAI